MKVVVMIPAYNEEKTIAKVVLLAQKQVDMVVVCDDGSKDLTADIAERLGVTVIRHDKNSGYGAAIQSLFRKAMEMNADVMVTLDADGQHDPREIPQLTEPILDDKADVALGSRFLGKKSDAPGINRKAPSFFNEMGAQLLFDCPSLDILYHCVDLGLYSYHAVRVCETLGKRILGVAHICHADVPHHLLWVYRRCFSSCPKNSEKSC